MEFFSINAFLLGLVVSSWFFLTNLFYSVIARWNKRKIKSFVLFQSPWFSLHTTTESGAKLILGWLPISSYITIDGFVFEEILEHIAPEDDTERQEIRYKPEERGALNQSKKFELLMRISPYLMMLFSLSLAFFLLNGVNHISDDLSIFFYYMKLGFWEIALGKGNNKAFQALIAEILNGKNTVLFSFILFVFINFGITRIYNIAEWTFNDLYKRSVAQKIVGSLVIILMIWFYFWKLPLFMLSYFTFVQILLSCIRFLIGALISGALYYLVILSFFKYILEDNY